MRRIHFLDMYSSVCESSETDRDGQIKPAATKNTVLLRPMTQLIVTVSLVTPLSRSSYL